MATGKETLMRRRLRTNALAGALTLGLIASGIAGGMGSAAAGGNAFDVTNLVSDQVGEAATLDPNLVNAWGLAAGPTSPWWVNAADADVSVLYDGDGNIIPLVVKVPGGPTGLVFNGGPNFVVSRGDASGPSFFIFATESGTIRGWNPLVPPPAPSTKAFVVADRSRVDASYKGLAIASTTDGDFLYAADFHNARVDVFDGEFKLVKNPDDFVDPNLPAGFAPFGIQNIGGTIFVAYALKDEEEDEEIAGQGLGFVDMFDTSGVFLGRVASRGALNAPWGLAMAPDRFGSFGGDLLVGNFGNGEINAYEQQADGSFVHDGKLRDAAGKAISIDGLWALEFGNGSVAGPTDTLFFTAGPDEEEHGLFGKIEATG
jgi:uncharacterized protein (TIGR03118 family)